MMMINPGTTVYVHWYGKLLQGTVVNDNDLMGMVAVRIPLMGGHPVALFTPAHVYESETAANGIQAGEPHKKLVESRTTTTCKDSMPGDVPTSSTKSNPSEARRAIQKFKEENWDREHNHLRIDALDEFYQLWRTSIAAKLGFTIVPTAPTVSTADPPTVFADPSFPDGDRSSIMIVDANTGTIVPSAAVSQQPQPLIGFVEQVAPSPVLTNERHQEPKQKTKAKVTKNSSTGRIEYSDSIQTSFFLINNVKYVAALPQP